MEFPEPDQEALAHSSALAARIRDEIERCGGWMPFERYMQRALYEPGLGYYSAGSVKFGAAGDFVTAPELGGFLAAALAAQTRELLEALHEPVVLELGAGTGRLAEQLLDAYAALGLDRIAYRILEPSAELAQRQRTALERFGDRVVWLDRLPERPFEGLVIANEVVDALPVTRFVKQDGRVRALGVGVEAQQFRWAAAEADAQLAGAVERIERALGAPFPDGFRSEISRWLPGWLEALAAPLERGAALLVDYGLERRSYYHPERSDGTLICHYRQRAHADPFVYPGLQDISAWVDFSACAEAARAAGFSVAGYTTQGSFLLEQLGGAAGALVADMSLQASSALKTLVLPGEMGERFKVLALTRRDADLTLAGRDFLSWL